MANRVECGKTSPPGADRLLPDRAAREQCANRWRDAWKAGMRRTLLMVAVVAVALASAVFAASFAWAQPSPSAVRLSSCGIERWSVKTLQDADVGKIRLSP